MQVVSGVVTRILVLGMCVGAGWLIGTALRARTAVRGIAIGTVDMSAFPAAGMMMGRGGTGAVPAIHLFGDYECGACRELEQTIGDSLRSLADAGRIQLIYHHAPLRTHIRGPLAARVVYCAEEQGMGWAVHRMLYRTASRWAAAPLAPDSNFSASALLVADAVGAGADGFGLRKCIDSGTADAAVEQDRALADHLNIHAVPTVLLNQAKLEFRSYHALIRYITRHTT